MSDIYIKVCERGPYILYGIKKIPELIVESTNHYKSAEYVCTEVHQAMVDPVALCRCGHTHKVPFCDRTHAKVNFQGYETAGFATPEAERILRGPYFTLSINQEYCSFGRFCEVGGQIDNLVFRNDKFSQTRAIENANNCPSGAICVIDQRGRVVEPSFKPNVTVIEYPEMRLSGPIWLRGKIPVESADGDTYPVRNRQTLCRCGHSKNMPFCSGYHAMIKFRTRK